MTITFELTMAERRSGFRAPIRAEVEVVTDLMGTITCITRELSDNGAFIESVELTSLPVGTLVSVQAIGFPEPMPVLNAEIVRVESTGIAVKFLL